jgi:hypothetical protein
LVLLIQASDPATAGIFYLARPILAGVHGAFRTYYFDFKLLQDVCPEVLFESFMRRLVQAAIAIGTISGVLMAGLALVWMQSPFWPLLLSFVAFGISRSLFSLAQVESFAQEAYVALIATTVVLGALVTAIGLIPQTLSWLSFELAAGLTGAAFALRLFCFRDTAPHFIEPFSSWVPRVARTTTPVVVIAAQIDKQTKVTRKSVLSALRERYPRGFLALEGKSRLLLCLPGIEQDEVKEELREASLCTAGALRLLRAQSYSDGKDALLAFAKAEANILPESRRTELRVAMAELPIEVPRFLAQLKAEVPDIQIVRPGVRVRWEPSWSPERLSGIIGLKGPARARRVYSCVFPRTGDRKSVLLLCYRTSQNSGVLRKWAPLIEKEALAHGLLALNGNVPQVRPIESQRRPL